MKASDRRPIGIRAKLFGSFALLTLLTVLLLWLFQILLLPYFHRDITRYRLASEAEGLFGVATYEELRGKAETISREHNTGIRIYEVEGTVASTVLALDGEPGSVISLLSKRQLNDLFAAAEGGTWVNFQLREGDFRFVWEMDDGEEYDGKVIDERQVYAVLGRGLHEKLYFILLDASLEPIDGTVRVLSIQLVALTAVLLLLAALLAWRISKRISEPLAYLNVAARRLPRGEYPTEYREDAYREVAELSETLSAAATEIGKVDALQKELIANISHDRDFNDPSSFPGGSRSADRSDEEHAERCKR